MRGSTWVTRPRPHIDRIASAWLIKRFCDPDATFAFADAADAARKGIPFDVLGADFGHHGEDCTFETLVRRFGLKDRRVWGIILGRFFGDPPKGNILDDVVRRVPMLAERKLTPLACVGTPPVLPAPGITSMSLLKISAAALSSRRSKASSPC